MMDPADVTVSLDELTFDLSGENAEEEKCQPGREDFSTDKDNSTVEENIPDLVENQLDRRTQYTLDEDQPFEFEPTAHNQTDDGNKDTVVNQEADDFDIDIPPLSLFPSAKGNESDDSDSEFEIPERSVHSANISSQVEIQGASNEAKEFGIPIQNDSTSFQPEILTPRDKRTTDLTLSNERSELANYNKEAETPDKSTSFMTEQQEEVQDSTQKAFSGITVHIPHISADNSQAKTPNLPAAAEVTVINDNSETQKPDIVTTAEDWEGVQTVEPGFVKPGEKSSDPGAGFESKPLLTFAESWNEFESQDYSSVKGDIRPSIERKGFSAFTHMLFGPPKLQRDLIPQRDLIFCIAATPFHNDSKGHSQVLQTVYRILTGSKFECRRYGNHWEEIGFQGQDPATDLRGVGMLALLHLLYFLQDPSTKDLARDVYKLSLHPTQNFPFCVIGINLSRTCIQVLREEVYNRECNKRKDVSGTVNSIYAALFLQFYKIWKQGKTIADSGFVLKEIETYSRKQAKSIFKDLDEYEKTRRQQGPFGEHEKADQSFFSVCKEDQCDAKSAAELY